VAASSIEKGIGKPAMAEKIEWLNAPEDHDYAAALSYLSLLYVEQTAADHVNKLKVAPMSEFKAKDIFRACGLSLLGISNSHVEKDRQKIRAEHKLSPILLVRDSANGKVIVADGYHRLCAVYSYDEDAIIPCKIV
jgi:disulfide oxidoreductase YuzD